MDNERAYRLVSGKLEELGVVLQPLPPNEFAAAWKKANEIIGSKDAKQPRDVCEHAVLLPFYLAIRFQEATSAGAFLFGYEIDYPPMRKRFYVLAPSGEIFARTLPAPDIEIPVTL